MKQLIPALALTLLLSACGLRVPTITAGSLEIYQNGKIASIHQLKAEEVMALAEWFQASSAGWKQTAAVHPPATIVRLRHLDDNATVLNVLPAAAIVTNASGQYEKILSPEEEAHLRFIIGETKAGTPSPPTRAAKPHE
jgi:hypothetical protein